MNLTDEDKKFLEIVEERIDKSFNRKPLIFLGFYNEHEIQLIKDYYHYDDDHFYGGYEGAKRRLFCVKSTDHNLFEFDTIQISYRECDELTHRDILGALMSLGVERFVIGDILVSKGVAYAFVRQPFGEYALEHLTKIKNVGVKLRLVHEMVIPFEQEYEDILCYMHSTRLDSFVSRICKVSREEAQKYIKSELVNVNYYVETNNSKLLKVGDIITVRKYGKFVFYENSGLTKKGNSIILVKRYK